MSIISYFYLFDDNFFHLSTKKTEIRVLLVEEDNRHQKF